LKGYIINKIYTLSKRILKICVGLFHYSLFKSIDMIISENKVVSINYTLTDNEGAVLDTSEGRGVLSFIQGVGQIIPGLEKELEGKGKGDKFKVSIAPEMGYGLRDDAMMQQVPKAVFPADTEVTVGMQFYAKAEQGEIMVTVIKVEEETVTVDANHPLAGVTLNFDVEVMDVREATADEISHGHVH